MIQVKICGVTNPEDAQAAIEAGANLLGFNFYEKSIRRVSTVAAATIRLKVPEGVQTVGVFVNAPPEEISSLRAFVRFDLAQLHGDETPELVSRVARRVPVIKALRVGANFPFSAFGEYKDVFAYLLDAARPGQYGGTGASTDWDLARRASSAHPIFLAGGLTVENVAEAVRHVRPYAVDVASGVESKPGKKDHAKLRDFIAEVRRAERELQAAGPSATKTEESSKA